MSNIFISCAYGDNMVAKSLEEGLLAKGHRTRLPIGAAIAGEWRAKITKALVASDVLIAFLTEAGLASRNVLGEIGAARVLAYSRGLLMLPVLPAGAPIPDFISDIFCFRLQVIPTLVEELHTAIVDNVKLVPRVFISHRHKDEPIARALTALLEDAFYIENNSIRCTSVQPYMLTPGERTSEQLRTDIASAELVIGLLSPDTSESNYVICELGASWGRDVPTFPVLARGATLANVPSPLNERHTMSLEQEENCLQLIDHVANMTSLQRRQGAMGRVAQKAKLLAECARDEREKAASPVAQ